MDKAAFLGNIQHLAAQGRPIVMSGVGSGLTAKAAAQGGADLLATYHTAACRIEGIPTQLSFMPYGDCNQITFSLLKSIRPLVPGTPLLAGLGAHNPLAPPESLVAQAEQLGADGVLNEPFIGAYGEAFAARAQAAGIGFDREVELIAAAAKRGMLSLAWCFSRGDAQRMAQAGATLVGALVPTNPLHVPSVDEMAAYVNEIVAGVADAGSSAPVLVHGGPLDNLEIVAAVLARCNAAGYATGSAAERLPVTQTVTNAVRAFKKLHLKPQQTTPPPN